jgi:hypothetical protein
MNPGVRQLLMSRRSSYGFFHAKDLIRKNAADVNILVVGDSTGNASDEWVYLFSEWLAAQYPTHSVSYRLWNDATPAYDAATAISIGSGSNTIRIWNASISGAAAFYLIGTKLQASVTDTNADLVIFNHGKNHTGVNDPQCRGELLMALETVKLALPNARLASFLQFANRDDSNMDIPAAAWRSIAGLYSDLPTLDGYGLSLGLGKAADLYVDNLHPSSKGTDLCYLEPLKQAWKSSNADKPSIPAYLSKSTTNLLQNAKFYDPAVYSGGTPTGWTAAATPTGSVEAAIVDAGKSQALKVVGTSAGARFTYTLSAAERAQLLGGPGTLAVRRHAPSGSASTVGRIALAYTDGGTTTTTTRATLVTQGAYVWWVIAGLQIPASATVVFVQLYCDTAANADSAAYYSEASLVPGFVPLLGA